MPTILGANTLSSGYDVANSVRFDGSSAYMNKTFGTPTNNKKWTYSFWIKKSGVTGNQALLACGADSNNRGLIYLADNGKLYYYETSSNTDTTEIGTNRLFRDPSAWYHIVVAVDTSQGTEANRVKIYVNGTQETSLAASNYPSQDATDDINSAIRHDISGRNHAGSSDLYLNGYMAEVVFIDGQQLAPTSFGEFDEDSPTHWKPINVSGLTFGNNGFYLDFEDSSNLGNDKNGGTDLTEVNLAATDQSTDTCTNNFCVMNPILGALYTPTFTQGNLQVAQSVNNQHAVTHGTFAVTKGVWYWEVKYIGNTGTSGPSDRAVGIQTPNVTNVFTQATYNGTGSVTYYGYDGGEVWDEGTATTADYGTYSQNSILGISLDMDNGVISFYINGTEVVDNYALGTSASVIATPAIAWPNGTASGTEMGVNFGSPFYALSSAVADANGYGAFEYTPVGYALCTKNLAEFG